MFQQNLTLERKNSSLYLSSRAGAEQQTKIQRFYEFR